MHYVLLILGIIFGIYGLYRFFLNANLKQIMALFMVGGFSAVFIAIFFFAITGRLPAAFSLLALLWPLVLGIWHKRKNKPENNDPSKPMTREEALEILGLEDGATIEEIKAAYKKLIKKTHPDKEGSEWLAAKINQAKVILLGK